MGVNGIYGLSGSGIDVESMVKVGMMSKQKEYEKMQQKYTLNEWKKTEYLSLYNEVQTFNNSSLSDYKMSGNMNARSASSANEKYVTATANANAAPMAHTIEVGQLAASAYLIGTTSPEVLTTSKDTSTELKDYLFKSLEVSDTEKGSYVFKDTNGVSTVKGTDIAFTFTISDGSEGGEYLSSTNENVFSAIALDSNGNALSDITNDTKINSHTVLLESLPTNAKTITSLKINNGLTSETSLKTVFQNIFDIPENTYNNRIGRLAGDDSYKNQIAFSIKFDDGTTNTATASFTYSDLMDSDTSFYGRIKSVVDSAENDLNNISVDIVDGQLQFSNTNKKGSESKINISIEVDNTATSTFIGNDTNSNTVDNKISNLPQLISESGCFRSNVEAKASDVFVALLGADKYGGAADAKTYIKKNSDSDETALTIKYTKKTAEGSTSAATANITFAQLAKSDAFSDVIKSSLTEAGFTDTISDITVNTTTGKFTAVGENSLEFSIANAGIGDEDHVYATSNVANNLVSNLAKTIAKSPSLLSSSNAVASDVFASMLAVDQYGGKTYATSYLKAYKDSNESALDINYTKTTEGGMSSEGNAYITFEQLASKTAFSELIKESLNITDTIDKVNVDTATGKITITDDAKNSFVFSIANDAIGDEDHAYLTSAVATKLVSNLSKVIANSNDLLSNADAKASDVFVAMLGVGEEGRGNAVTDYITANKNSGDKALTINYTKNGSTSAVTANITFEQLASGDAFSDVIKSNLGIGNLVGKITVDTTTGKFTVTDDANNSFVFSIENAGIQYTTATDYKLSNIAEATTASNDLLSNANVAASDVFASLLAMDEYGGSTTSAQYIEKYKNSTAIALAIQITDTKNGTSTFGTANITFKQLASDKAFSEVIKSSLTQGGLKDLAENLSIDTATRKLVISNKEYGEGNSVEFALLNIGVGDEEHPYPTATPPTKIIPNQSISEWFDSINGNSVGADEYMKRLIEIRGDGKAGDTAFDLKIADGQGNSATVRFTYNDLADTNTTLSKKLESALSSCQTAIATDGSSWITWNIGNVRINYESNSGQIEFSNNRFGDDSQISVTLENIGSYISDTTLETNGKIELKNLTSTDILNYFFRDVTSKFTQADRNAWVSENDTSAAFKLAFKTSDGSFSTTAFSVSYKELRDSQSGSLESLLKKAVSSTYDASNNFEVRTEADSDGKNAHLVIYNTKTGSTSSIQAVISDVSMGLSPHLAGSAATRSFSLSSATVNSKLNELIGGKANIVEYTNSESTAFTMTFEDNKGNSDTASTTWVNLIGGNFSTIKKSHAFNSTTGVYDITWNSESSLFENARLSTASTIVISTTPSTTTTVYYKKSIDTTSGVSDISTDISTAITKTKVEAIKINKTQVTPTQVSTSQVTTTSASWESSSTSDGDATQYTYTINGSTITSTEASLYYYTDPTNSEVITTTSSSPSVYYYQDPTNTENVISTTESAPSVYYYQDPTNTENVISTTESAPSVYYYKIPNDTGDVSTDTTNFDEYYYINPTNNSTVSIGTSSTTNCWSYTFSGTTYSDTTSNTVYQYNDPTNSNNLKSSTTKVYSYTDLSDTIQTSTSKHYLYTNPNATKNEAGNWESKQSITTATRVYITSTTVLDASMFLSGKIDSETKHNTATSTAKNDATNGLSTLFNTSEIGTTNALVRENPVENFGSSTNQNSALIGNISNFLGTSLQVGDDGGDYKPDYFANKLLSFFGGGTGESIQSEIDSTKTTYSIEQVGSDGVAKIDGRSFSIAESDNNVIKTDDMQYTFKEGALGKGGVAYSKNDAQEVSITYEQLANGFTLNDLAAEVNSLGLNVRMTYDSVNNKMSIYNKESGAANEIRIGFNATTDLIDTTKLSSTKLETAKADNAAIEKNNSMLERTVTFFNSLGLRQSENGMIDNKPGGGVDATDFDFVFATGKTSVLAGKNAVAKVDGIDYYDLEQNHVSVGGVTYTFNQVTTNDLVVKYKQDSNGNYLTEDGKITTNITEAAIEKDVNGNAVKVIGKYKTDSNGNYLDADGNITTDVDKLVLEHEPSNISVTINQDTEKIINNVKSFVEKYNSLIEKLYSWYDEKPNSDYKPLTASQKETMKEEQIEKWEAKAKAGMLYHDSTLYSVINDMRQAISTRVSGLTGSYDNIFALGISVGNKGQLTIDEDALNAALAKDPDSVYNVFAKLDSQDRASYNGVAQRLGDVFTNGLNRLKEVSGSSSEITDDSTLNNLLRELQVRMSNFKALMDAFETRLYKKYDAMETSLSMLGAQLNYVTGAFNQ